MTELLTVEQAAARLSISPRAVQHRIRSGSLQAQRFGAGRTSPWMIPAEAVQAALDAEVARLKGQADA